MRLEHVLPACVVMAREHDAVAFRVFHEMPAVRQRVPLLNGLCIHHLAVEFLVGPAFLAGVVDPRLFDVLPLPLAGRMVHQRDQADARVADKGLEQLDRVRRRQFAAHVQQVLGAQEPVLGRAANGVDDFAPALAAQGILVGIADPEGVEYCGDARSRDFGVMRQERRQRGPAHLRARHQVALEVVGMELDQPGQEEIAF